MKNFIIIIKCFFVAFLYVDFLYSSSLEKLSGISVIIGNDIILDSEIGNLDDKKSLCNPDIINDFLIQRFMLYYAKKDKSIQINDRELELRTQMFISEMKKKYVNREEFLTQLENKNFLKEITEKIINQQYIEKYYNKITKEVETSPEEVKYFLLKKQNKIPYYPKKICISYIIFYPKLSQTNKKKIIGFLNKIKKEIHSDTDFYIKAILYSEDEASALQGGFVKDIKINDLSKKFAHLVLSLKEGEMSEPFETDLGFHLIKMEKKRKNDIDFKHILIKPKYSKYELYKTKSFAEFFRKRIISHKINIDQIPNLLSQNKIVNVIVQNKIWIDENQLSKNMKKAFILLKKGKITYPYKEIINGKEAFVIFKLLDEIPSQPVSFEKNYSILKNFVIDIKKKDKVKNWAKEILKKTYYAKKMNC
ncbi:peptidylprolyl isomerase [Blattabacterium sp. (Blaberus giganteus)]|uniref:peptidylprolyl isomerase n=1 Tax=Blattabacterium sp. (Blaberus giganteus) TaxID=1186051 RepID=UPI00025F7066|nr:peptidylprolyl isomerase [Blattabacterium sp. (Blaberus giganteus)]AFJ90480.1 peptidyl-prolyl cis-trans isomerase precursor [Blattabacterium sp. (Blaberus giganteus)]